MTCSGHALIRWYENGHWYLICVNADCTYRVQEG